MGPQRGADLQVAGMLKMVAHRRDEVYNTSPIPGHSEQPLEYRMSRVEFFIECLQLVSEGATRMMVESLPADEIAW